MGGSHARRDWWITRKLSVRIERELASSSAKPLSGCRLPSLFGPQQSLLGLRWHSRLRAENAPYYACLIEKSLVLIVTQAPVHHLSRHLLQNTIAHAETPTARIVRHPNRATVSWTHATFVYVRSFVGIHQVAGRSQLAQQLLDTLTRMRCMTA